MAELAAKILHKGGRTTLSSRTIDSLPEIDWRSYDYKMENFFPFRLKVFFTAGTLNSSFGDFAAGEFSPVGQIEPARD